jgi:hypothetical protein
MSRPKADFCKNGHPKTRENLSKNGGCKLCAKRRQEIPEYKAQLKGYRDNLADSYIAAQLGLPVADCPPKLIEMKRQSIIAYRLIKKITLTIENGGADSEIIELESQLIKAHSLIKKIKLTIEKEAQKRRENYRQTLQVERL